MLDCALFSEDQSYFLQLLLLYLLFKELRAFWTFLFFFHIWSHQFQAGLLYLLLRRSRLFSLCWIYLSQHLLAQFGPAISISAADWNSKQISVWYDNDLEFDFCPESVKKIQLRPKTDQHIFYHGTLLPCSPRTRTSTTHFCSFWFVFSRTQKMTRQRKSCWFFKWLSLVRYPSDFLVVYLPAFQKDPIPWDF